MFTWKRLDENGSSLEVGNERFATEKECDAFIASIPDSGMLHVVTADDIKNNGGALEEAGIKEGEAVILPPLGEVPADLVPPVIPATE